MASPLILTYMNGLEDGQTVHIPAEGNEAIVTIGRLPECTVCIADDPDASRQHARILCRNKEWWLEDMGSANGTFIGEFAQSQRLTSPIKLVAGQIFRVGLTRFRLENEDSDESMLTMANPVKAEFVPIAKSKPASADDQLDRLLQSVPFRNAASRDLKRALGVPEAQSDNSSTVLSFPDQVGKMLEITVELAPKIDQIQNHPWIFSCKMKSGWFLSLGFCYVRDNQVYIRIDGRPQLFKIAAKSKVEGSIYMG